MCLVTIISHLLLSLQYWPQIILLLTLPICVLTTHCTATINSAQLYMPPSFGPWYINVPLSHPNTAMFLWPTKQMSFIFAIVVQPYTFRKLSLLPALKILPQTLQKIAFFSYSLLPWPPWGKGLKSVILKFLLPNKSPWALNDSTCIDYHLAVQFWFSFSCGYFWDRVLDIPTPSPVLVFKLLFSRLLPNSK